MVQQSPPLHLRGGLKETQYFPQGKQGLCSESVDLRSGVKHLCVLNLLLVIGHPCVPSSLMHVEHLQELQGLDIVVRGVEFEEYIDGFITFVS